MAMISVFSNFVLLFVTAHVTNALNSPIPFVHTVSSVTLISGKEATLTCKYNRTVYAVYWRYESTASPMELLVVMDEYYEEGKRSGPGYDEGRFDITDDYSLIIHDVQATDEGKYICEVSDFETGSTFRNHTDVTTVVTAERPFIRIEQCENVVSADKINEPCVLHTLLEDRTVQLTCIIVGAKPLVDLTWEASMPSEQWKHVMNESALTQKDRGDGIFDQTLTVIVDTSYIKSNKQHFTCVGKGLAVDGLANYTIAVYRAQGSNEKPTVVITVVCTLFFTFVIIGVLWTWWKVRDKRRMSRKNITLEEKVKKIKDMNADEPVYLGVLGDKGAGKTSFIDSVKFVIQRTDESTPQQSGEGDDADNSSDIWKCTEFISTGLHIRKIRDEKTFEAEENKISSVLMFMHGANPSSSQGIDMKNNNLIHYPIFVFDIRNKGERDSRIESLNEFSNAVYCLIGEHPMLVLTKATATTYEKVLEELIEKIEIPRENILVTFHYFDSQVKSDNNEEELLDFILKCIAKAEMQKNIKNPFRRSWWRKRRSYMAVQSSDTAV